MEWKIDESLPIRTQLTEQLASCITSGKYKPGERLPSVRELAAEAGVNPNTMQRAFAELEGMGLVVTNRTAGRKVTEDTERISRVREEQVRNHIDKFFENMRGLGYGTDEIKKVLLQALEEVK